MSNTISEENSLKTEAKTVFEEEKKEAEINPNLSFWLTGIMDRISQTPEGINKEDVNNFNQINAFLLNK